MMSTKSQVLRVIFRTPGWVDVEPPSVADSLHEYAVMSPRAYQAAVDAAVDDIESEVVKIYFLDCPSSPTSSRNIFILVIHRRLITPRCKLLTDRFDVFIQGRIRRRWQLDFPLFFLTRMLPWSYFPWRILIMLIGFGSLNPWSRCTTRPWILDQFFLSSSGAIRNCT
jgi:hypothetical protein